MVTADVTVVSISVTCTGTFILLLVCQMLFCIRATIDKLNSPEEAGGGGLEDHDAPSELP